MLSLILRPFAFLSIKHSQKQYFDWVLPAGFSLVCLAFTMVFRDSINIAGSLGLVDRVLSFVQILPGFYIAALAAIATFNRDEMDDYMPEPTPNLKLHLSGQENVIRLTRRRFLCMLFAYLTALSLVLCVVSVGALVGFPAISHYFVGSLEPIMFSVFIFFYFFLFWQLLFETMLGIYYLGERIHQS